MSSSYSHDVASHELPATPLDPEIAAQRAKKITISMISLCGCWGCSLSLLDGDERMIDLLAKATILRSSFTDIKRITQRCDIGFIEGGVANSENIETLKHFRQNCDILISVGACAIWGGVPSLRNTVGLRDCLDQAYSHSVTAPENVDPIVPWDRRIPVLTNAVYPCHEVVQMDYFIPGCPPSAEAILTVLENLVHGRPVNLPRSLTSYE